MSDELYAGLALADTHRDLVRNIVSLRVSEDLFDDLTDDPEARQAALALELQTKPALMVSRQPIIDRPFEESTWNTAIGYPFRNWTKSRYSDGSFGIWYGADTLRTTVYETVHHWRNGFLADAGFTQDGIRIERKLYNVRCDAVLIDVRAVTLRFPDLRHPTDYTLAQQVGARLHREGHPGLVATSARCDGDVYALLNPAVLTDPRQICFLTYTTTTQGVSIEREPGVSMMLI